MSKLTLEDAISHCLEVAEQNETQADKIGRQFIGSAMDKCATDCRECAADHRQLAEWLTELKELRNSLGAVKLKDMKEAVKLLQELNTEKDQITSQLAYAKGLLKLALNDFETIESNLEYDEHCVIKTHSIRCDECPLSAETIYRCKWRYADEAKKLLNDEK